MDTNPEIKTNGNAGSRLKVQSANRHSRRVILAAYFETFNLKIMKEVYLITGTKNGYVSQSVTVAETGFSTDINIAYPFDSYDKALQFITKKAAQFPVDYYQIKKFFVKS